MNHQERKKLSGRTLAAAMLLSLLPAVLPAQEVRLLRKSCLGTVEDNASVSGSRKNILPACKTDWDANTIYKQMVVLVSFADRDFSWENPRETYDSIFNVPGFNKGVGAGCVADYFRDQSNGLFNLQFDIYGPIKVGGNCKSYGNDGITAFHDAVVKLKEENPEVNFNQYDWDNNGTIEQVVIIYAGYGGNEETTAGCIWPNTHVFNTVQLPGNVKLRNYSASAELFSNNASCGIGTICHEYTHCLGLPDLYPTGDDDAISVVDEWDLMDGGNFTNNGWCPPSFSSFEKYQLGWLTPIELNTPTTITNLAPSNRGGEVYIVKHTTNEYYLLENRQWHGWDRRLPGRGLLVTYVDYDYNSWNVNEVNSNPKHRRFDLVHADNLDYSEWEEVIGGGAERVSGHSRYLSGTPYPYVGDGIEVRELTDESTPCSQMYNTNRETNSKMLSKPITNIVVKDELVSFDFMGGNTTGITDVSDRRHATPTTICDLQGRQVANPQKGVIYIVDGKKKIFF